MWLIWNCLANKNTNEGIQEVLSELQQYVVCCEEGENKMYIGQGVVGANYQWREGLILFCRLQISLQAKREWMAFTLK